MNCGQTHYAGCECHENQWREKLEKAERERDEALQQRDEAMNYLRATQRQLTLANADRGNLVEALKSHKCYYLDKTVTCPQCAAIAAVDGGGK